MGVEVQIFLIHAVLVTGRPDAAMLLTGVSLKGAHGHCALPILMYRFERGASWTSDPVPSKGDKLVKGAL